MEPELESNNLMYTRVEAQHVSCFPTRVSVHKCNVIHSGVPIHPNWLMGNTIHGELCSVENKEMREKLENIECR